MSACACMGCPHIANCRCRCVECQTPTKFPSTFQPFPFKIDTDELAEKIAAALERRALKRKSPSR